MDTAPQVAILEDSGGPRKSHSRTPWFHPTTTGTFLNISKNGIFNNEADITYFNSSLKNHIVINKKYNQRYYFRVLYNKTSFKDNILDAVIKFLNKSF